MPLRKPQEVQGLLPIREEPEARWQPLTDRQKAILWAAAQWLAGRYRKEKRPRYLTESAELADHIYADLLIRSETATDRVTYAVPAEKGMASVIVRLDLLEAVGVEGDRETTIKLRENQGGSAS